jgi:2,5-dihydroxypyridine 5,6-dioxygenase
MPSDPAMIALFREELELCKIAAGDTVAILSEGAIRADYAEAFLLAAAALGAAGLNVNLAPRNERTVEDQHGRNALTGNRVAIDALSKADIVIDLMGLLFSPEQDEITRAGARMLLVVEPFNVLQSMFPSVDVRRRVEYGEHVLKSARELRVTSDAGTDIRYAIGQYPVMTEYGFTDTPGRWDHFPSGFLLTQGLDAALLRGYIESYRDERAYAVSHIGWGLNEKAKWHHLAATREADLEIGVHALAYYGNVLFSLGPNTELGGTNDTPCHMDMPLRNCNLYLDGQPIVERGRVIPAEMRAAGW